MSRSFDENPERDGSTKHDDDDSVVFLYTQTENAYQAGIPPAANADAARSSQPRNSTNSVPQLPLSIKTENPSAKGIEGGKEEFQTEYAVAVNNSLEQLPVKMESCGRGSLLSNSAAKNSLDQHNVIDLVSSSPEQSDDDENNNDNDGIVPVVPVAVTEKSDSIAALMTDKKATCPAAVDVLCGPDESYANHPGNRIFHQHVENKKVAFCAASNTEVQMAVAKDIVTSMRIEHSSRFLKLEGQAWFEVSTQAAWQAVLSVLCSPSRNENHSNDSGNVVGAPAVRSESFVCCSSQQCLESSSEKEPYDGDVEESDKEPTLERKFPAKDPTTRSGKSGFDSELSLIGDRKRKASQEPETEGCGSENEPGESENRKRKQRSKSCKEPDQGRSHDDVALPGQLSIILTNKSMGNASVSFHFKLSHHLNLLDAVYQHPAVVCAGVSKFDESLSQDIEVGRRLAVLHIWDTTQNRPYQTYPLGNKGILLADVTIDDLCRAVNGKSKSDKSPFPTTVDLVLEAQLNELKRPVDIFGVDSSDDEMATKIEHGWSTQTQRTLRGVFELARPQPEAIDLTFPLAKKLTAEERRKQRSFLAQHECHATPLPEPRRHSPAKDAISEVKAVPSHADSERAQHFELAQAESISAEILAASGVAEKTEQQPAAKDESPPCEKSPQENMSSDRCFRQLVYGKSARDRIAWWNGHAFDRKLSSDFIFDDDKSVVHDSQTNVCSTDNDSDKSDSGADSGYPGAAPQKLKRPKRPIKTVQTRSLANIEYALPPEMSCVEHMSCTEFDEHGRPVQTIVVYGEHDDVLYRFRIDTAESKIPGAGLGAFLTYLGSLHRNPKLDNLIHQCWDAVTLHNAETAEPLEIVGSNGLPATLKLTGDNLHGINNNPYLAKTMSPLHAMVTDRETKRKRRVQVHLKGDGLHDIPELEALRKRGMPGECKVGFLGALLDSDFIPGDKDFDIHDCSIYLGRYGPFLKGDRKPEGLFLCSNFLFQNAPMQYCFEVPEEYINNQPQWIDITDPSTGLPHEEARRHVNMYVNEVGHDLLKKQNVFNNETKGRTIQYHFVLPDDESMKQGDRVELLTNYFHGYETSRERGGYGLKNLFKHKKSDEDYASFLERRLGDRRDIANIAHTVNIVTVDIMEHLKESTYNPLMAVLRRFLETGDCSVISELQLVALRRILWLKSRFADGVDHWEETLRKEYDGHLPDAAAGAIVQCRRVLAEICGHDYLHKQVLTDDRTLKGSTNSIADVMLQEAVEEACFALRTQLVRPFDESMWCSISRRLFRKLSYITAELFWSIELTANSGDVLCAQKNLANNIIRAGEEAVAEIREAVKFKKLKDLSFGSGLNEGTILWGDIRETLFTKSFFLDHSVTPKGYMSAAFDQLSYAESLSVAFESPLAFHEEIRLDHEELFIMVSYYPFAKDKECYCTLGSIPRPIAKISLPADINVTWYIIHQVIFVVEAFGRAFCGTSDLVDELCSRLCVPTTAAGLVAVRGINTIKDSGCMEFCRAEYQIKFDKIIDLPRSVCSKNPISRQSGSNTGLSWIKNMKSGHVIKPLSSSQPVSKTLYTLPGGGRPSALFLREEKPDEPLQGGRPWPDGWTKKIFQRMSGGTAGLTDRYWFSPLGYKFRSMVEVNRFMALLQSNSEANAWFIFKGKKPRMVIPAGSNAPSRPPAGKGLKVADTSVKEPSKRKKAEPADQFQKENGASLCQPHPEAPQAFHAEALPPTNMVLRQKAESTAAPFKNAIVSHVTMPALLPSPPTPSPFYSTYLHHAAAAVPAPYPPIPPRMFQQCSGRPSQGYPSFLLPPTAPPQARPGGSFGYQ